MQNEAKRWNDIVNDLVNEIKEDIEYEQLDKCEAYEYAMQSVNDYIAYNDADIVISYIGDNGLGSVENFEDIYHELFNEVMDIFEKLVKGEKC